MNSSEIRTFRFDKTGLEEVRLLPNGTDWPVVYLITNSKDVYIGETSSASNRMTQHLDNPERKSLKEIHILFDNEFNKSAILDIEQSLIQLVSADNKLNLLNRNGGQSQKHNYFQREKYQAKIGSIWQKLQNMQLASKNYDDILNSDLFKFSPYNSLTEEQSVACYSALDDVIDKLRAGIKSSFVLHGSAGTGKSVVLVNILNRLINATAVAMDETDDEEELSPYLRIRRKIAAYVNENGPLKVALVMPMASIRKTLKAVFRQTGHGLKANMVIGPSDISNEEFDVLLVDEAHRLPQYKNISWMGSYKQTTEAIYGEGADPNDYTSLDWILNRSKYSILVYDSAQTVKGSDITEEQYLRAFNREQVSVSNHWLFSQMRCKGGQEYIDYLSRIFKCEEGLVRNEIVNYDFRLFEHIQDMIQAIKRKDKEIGLCRSVAGYSWEWVSKGCNSLEEVKRRGLEDITIEGYKYIWNMSNMEWILRPSSIDEIGCIHTTQGYDLNYVGVIFGEEIDYDKDKNQIIIDPSKHFDSNVQRGADAEELKKYLINSYKVMMSRGIKGCYVYACNPSLREYLSRFIPR